MDQSRECLAAGEHQFFAPLLGLKHAWRAYTSFAESCVYLDIETDGRTVTTIGLYDGRDYTCLIQGENLENFRDLISHFSMIVTFCGSTFDLPVLERAFPGLKFDHIHFDLCPVLRKLGYRGGLKSIENQMGIYRPDDLNGLTGFDALVLWRRYRAFQEESSLEKLIAYNREDVVNMKPLAEFAVLKMTELTLCA